MNAHRMFKKIGHNFKQALPDILVGAGLVGGIIAVVDFCTKTREATPVVEEYKEESANLVSEIKANEGTENAKELRKKLAVETGKTGVKLAKVYWRPMLIWSASSSCIIASHVMLRRRNAALIAAYAGIGAELRGLYKRIKERYGEDEYLELKHGITKQEIETVHIDEVTGEEVRKKEIVRVAPRDPNGYSTYARFFDESSRAWRDDPEYNLVYLKEIETECNRRLQQDGYLFLNDVYDKLDIKKTKAGQQVGWTYVKNGENPVGDNCVDFGLNDTYRPAMRDFVNGYESVVLLDFNVDGKIIDLLTW